MGSETVLLSRIQFALTIGYHILWPAYSIGISAFIVLLNALWLKTGHRVYRDLLRLQDSPLRARLCHGCRDRRCDLL